MKLPSSGRGRRQDTVQFQHAFWAAKRAISEAAGVAFQRHGIHAGQEFILRCLWDEDGLAPGEIAHRLELATSTVTKATARMQTAGLVIRRTDLKDRRLVRLFLTKRGRVLRDTINEEVDQLTEQALGTLSARQRKQLVDALVVIRRNLA